MSTEWQFHDPSSKSKYDAQHKDAKDFVTIHSGPETDWWSTAVGSTPESDAHRSSGPVVYRLKELPSSSNFTLSGWLSQNGEERFQQTTLFIRQFGSDTSNHQGDKWLKSGIENEEGIKYVGAVSTNPYSDWCLTPMPTQYTKVWIEIRKQASDIFIHYSYDGNKKFLLREVKGFCADTDSSSLAPKQWWIGAMVCGPKSQSTAGTVEDLRIDFE